MTINLNLNRKHAERYIRCYYPFAASFTAGVRAFQREFGGLAVNGRLDAKTQRALQIPRCGLPSCKPGVARIIDPQKRWRKPVVTVGVHRFVDKRMIPIADQIEAIQQALDAWQQGSKLQLRLARKSETPDIVMTTSSDRATGLGTPGNTLGYAYPPQGDDRQVRIVIDEAEAWQLWGDRPGYNFLGAFSHELGHGLGMDHQQELRSLMRAIYSDTILLPTEFDRALMAQLYGADDDQESPVLAAAVDEAAASWTVPITKTGRYQISLRRAA